MPRGFAGELPLERIHETQSTGHFPSDFSAKSPDSRGVRACEDRNCAGGLLVQELIQHAKLPESVADPGDDEEEDDDPGHGLLFSA